MQIWKLQKLFGEILESQYSCTRLMKIIFLNHVFGEKKTHLSMVSAWTIHFFSFYLCTKFLRHYESQGKASFQICKKKIWSLHGTVCWWLFIQKIATYSKSSKVSTIQFRALWHLGMELLCSHKKNPLTCKPSWKGRLQSNVFCP